MICVAPEIGKLIARYELGALDSAEHAAFVGHLVECEFCHNEVYEMEPAAELLRARREAVMSGRALPDEVALRRALAVGRETPSVWKRRVALAAAAAVLVVTGLAVIVARMQGNRGAGTPEWTDPSWADLAVAPLAYPGHDANAPVLRGGSTSAAFRDGIEAYGRGEYAEAAESLDLVCRMEPRDGEAHVYAGVALMMTGRFRDAITKLNAARDLTAGELNFEARYYLVLAFLKVGDGQQALSEVDEMLASGQEAHRSELESLRKKILAKTAS